MTIRQEFICDKKGCPSKELAVERPAGWHNLHDGDWPYDHHFCSVACLRDWLMDLAPAPGPNKGVVFTCDECGKEILMRPGDEWPVWCEMKVDGAPYRLGFCSRMCLYKFLYEHIYKHIDHE